MDQNAKLRMLKELDSKTDWKALIAKQQSDAKKSMSQAKLLKTSSKLSKAEKKKQKLEKQLNQVQEALKAKNIQTVVFNNPDIPANPLQRAQVAAPEGDADKNDRVELDLKQTRYEIMKFGMSSLSSHELVNAETALAISLGAKPPKRTAINYKELQNQRKRERELTKEQEASMVKPKLKNTMKKKSQQSNRGSSKNSRQSMGRGRSNSAQSSKFSKRHRHKTK